MECGYLPKALGEQKGVKKLKNINVIHWFVCLVRKDMDEYVENKDKKRGLYRSLRKKLNLLRLGEEDD